jgi:hypothetical protein
MPKLKKHTKTNAKPSQTGLGLILNSYGIIFGCWWLILGSSWGIFGGGNSKNIQKPYQHQYKAVWGFYAKLKKHTKTIVKPSQTGLGVILGSYGIIFGCWWLILGSSWGHCGDENSKNVQKPW